ncbi:MAG: proline racemase family protein, partial [Gemmatimonadota bacterium]
LHGAEAIFEPKGMPIQYGIVRPGLLADLVIVDQNPLQNLKVLYGTGAVRLNDATGKPERVGGVAYTIKDGIVFDAPQLLADVREMIKAATREQLPVVHPQQPGFEGVTIAQLSGPPLRDDADWQNAVVVSTGTLDWSRPSTWTGALDRSPCGTGTSAKMATLYARGRLGLHKDFRHAGILGTVFTGRLLEEVNVGPYRGVVPTISGQGWITGMATYCLDPTDPFPEGYTVGDIW